MAESTKTITWVSKLDSQLYPVITTPANKPQEILPFLEHKLESVLPDIANAQKEVEQRIQATEALLVQTQASDEKALSVKAKLNDLNKKLIEITSEYQILLQVLIGYFRTLEDIDTKADKLNSQFDKTEYPKDIVAVENLLREHELSRETLAERYRFAQTECEQIIQRIKKQEPEDSAEHDIKKLQHVLELRRGEFENHWRQRHDSLRSHRQICQFDHDLQQINKSLDDLDNGLKDIRAQCGESLNSAKAVFRSYAQFEKTIGELERRIHDFVKTGENLLAERHVHSPHINSQISLLQDRWNHLKQEMQNTEQLINDSIRYWETVEEANDWFREGSKLLVTIARKSTTVKQPEEARQLLSEIEHFLEPGAESQNQRIQTITELSTKLYGLDDTKYAPVVNGTREMFDSFSSIINELNVLSRNLVAAEEEKQRLLREQEEARKAEEARRQEEARLAEERRKAEEARLAELDRLAAERRMAEEVRIAEENRLAEERRRAEEAKIAEDKHRAELARLEAERLAEQARQEAEMLARERREAEEARLAEERKIAEERRKAEDERKKAEEAARLAEEARKAEELRIAEERRKSEEARTAEEAKRAEEARLAEEKRKAEEALLIQERKKAEQARLEAEHIAQQAKLEEQERRELVRLEEENLKIEKAKLEEEKMKAVQMRADEERRIAEQIRTEEEKLRAQQARLEEEKRKMEEARLEAERKCAEEEERRKAEVEKMEESRVQITEITEIHKTESIQREKSPIIEEALEAPVFTSPLSDAVIQEGSKFTFICQVTGNPTPNVIWYKAGVPIENNPDYHTSYSDGICCLTIEETFAEDSAQYICKASNSEGVAETSALLSVKEAEPEEQLVAPAFVKMLQPAVAKEGSSFQFICKVEGNPLPTVQWFKNGECIDNNPDYVITYNNGEAVLRFEKLSLEDKADYSCKATNELGTAQSTANLVVTSLEPSEAPQFILPLSNIMARAGQKIKLECEVSGLPLPILTWTHNSRPLRETRELKLQLEDNKATLIIPEAFPKDAGTYSVTAKNIAGEATSQCSVSVKGRIPTETSDSEMASDLEPIKPSIQLPLSNTTAREGSRVRLDCVIVGQPEPEVIWYHDNRPVKESPDFQLLFQGDRCSLIIQEALPEDAGEYKVVALNSAGEASSRCTLTVTPAASTEAQPEDKQDVGAPPKFTKLLTDVLVSEGEQVIFEGHVEGEPRPEVKWLLNNLAISDEEHFKMTYDNEGNIKLEIANVRPEDKGVYTVKASSPAGDAKCFAQLIVKSFKPVEAVVHEEVKTAPVFKELFNDKVVFEETSTKFECIVTGKPTPKVKWLFNGNPISGKDFLISTSGDRQVLSIPTVKKEHQGTITCVAENEAGKASCAATLTVHSSSEITLPEAEIPPLQTDMQHHVESSFTVNREVVTKSSTLQSSKLISSTSDKAEPHVEEHKVISEKEQTFKQIDQGTPEIKESHKIEEFHKIGQQPPVIQEKSSVTFSLGDKREEVHKTAEHEKVSIRPLKLSRPPRFTTPVIGKIVDQDVNVLLEGILEGQPTPEVSWTKNGTELKETDRIKISYKLNKVTVEIKNVTVNDAGRYSCTATNEAGKAVSTADLVVRKTIFPPVFGRRLQAQVVKKGERLIMEVEITGTPEPTVTWFKDGVEINNSKPGHKVKSMGPSHTVVIEKVDLSHSGRYMVRATNAGGEAQSIADIAVYEPTPDTMMEVVKTVVFEDVRKHETLTSAADKMSSTISAEKPISVSPLPSRTIMTDIIPPSTVSSSQISQSFSAKSEFSSVSEQKTSKEYQKFILEHKTPDVPFPKSIEPKQADYTLEKQVDYKIINPKDTLLEVKEEQRSDSKDEGIETSSITKQSSLQYFVNKIKDSDQPSQPKEPKSIPEPIKPEIFNKFTQEPQPASVNVAPIVPSKPFSPLSHEFKTMSSAQEIKQESKSFSSSVETTSDGVKQEFKSYSSQIIQPPQVFKSFSSNVERVSSVAPTTSSFSSTTFKQKPIQPFIHHHEFDLKPEPPAEICYAEKPGSYKKMEQVSDRIKKISENQKDISVPPLGGVKIFPSTSGKTEHFEERKEFSSSFQTSSYQTSSSSYTHERSSTPGFQRQWTPKLEIERPLSAASSYYSASEKAYSRPLSAQSGLTEPSQNALQMEKQWAHKFSETHVEKSWPPPQLEEMKSKPAWSVQSTLEKKWTPSSEVRSEHVFKKSEIIEQSSAEPVQHYIGEVEHLGTLVKEHAKLESSHTDYEVKSETKLEERSVKPAEIIKSWPPKQQYVPPAPKTLLDLPVRPVSVQDITNEVYLEPGPPPEIGYAEPPPTQRRQSYVEIIEQKLEQDLTREPEKVPPCAVAVVPRLPLPEVSALAPPLPPKKSVPVAPPLPAKPRKQVEMPSVPFTRFPELEPFPFKPDPERQRPPRTGPPPTPSKFIKGRFTDSDYESDFENVRIPPKWKPSVSDTEEPHYRRVNPPTLVSTSRSRSQEPEPLPPSKFDQPPQFQGPPRPEVNFEEARRKKTSSEIKKFTKHYEQMRREISPPKIMPASPPIYVQPEVKPQSPKVKRKTVQDGYMADTDEPFVQRSSRTEFSKEERMESRQMMSSSENYMESSSQKFVSAPKSRIVCKFPTKKSHVSSVSAKKELIETPIITSQTSEQYFEEHQKEMKSEVFRPVKPVLTPGHQQQQQVGKTPTPPTEFEIPPETSYTPRPKFQPIEKIKPAQKPAIFKPKPIPAAPVSDLVQFQPHPIILEPGTPPEIGYAPPPKKTQYYRSTVSAPYHNAVQTETSNVMHFNESTDHCHRTMSVQQTHKVIRFGDQYAKQEQKLEEFPFKPEPQPPRRATSVPPPPTPSKFIPGEFRESDYESEVESARIKPKWTPGGTDANSYHYRRVQAPSPASMRSSSAPGPKERVLTPMEFDRGIPLMPTQISTDAVDGETRRQHSSERFSRRSDQIAKRSHSYETPQLHPGSPPEYGFAPSQVISRQTATKLASHHMDSMTKEFKTKTQQFVQDVVTDRQKLERKPILKHSKDGDAQVYREETRASEKGTKHIDPDTGLIYFKYDFGYEFGILLPGESRNGEVPTPKKTIIEPPKRTVDIEMPVYHETTHNSAPTPQFKPKKFASKPWDPTSESDMSEYEGDGRKRSQTPGSRWEHSSCSPASLSPSLPSTSPAFNHFYAGSGRIDGETPSSCPTTPGAKIIIPPGQAKPPMFITPLRDIAVVSGQAAKFECIVQAEPQPDTLWSKDGRILQPSRDYQIHYRNGVCRLTISRAYPEDAGTYTCTATNSAGTANTTATLQVPGERRSQYIK